MADTLDTTNPSIERLCHDWEVALARLNLESLEAPNDKAVAAACERADRCAAELYEEIEDRSPRSIDDLAALLGIALKLLEENPPPAGEIAQEYVHGLVQKVRSGLFYVERQMNKEASNGKAN